MLCSEHILSNLSSTNSFENDSCVGGLIIFSIQMNRASLANYWIHFSSLDNEIIHSKEFEFYKRFRVYFDLCV